MPSGPLFFFRGGGDLRLGASTLCAQYQDTMQARWMAVEVAELKHTVDNVLDVLTGMMNSVLESHRSKEQGSLAEDGRRGSEAGKLWLQHMMLNLEVGRVQTHVNNQPTHTTRLVERFRP